MCDTVSGLACYFYMNVIDGEAEAQGVTSLKQLTGSSKNAYVSDIPFYILYFITGNFCWPFLLGVCPLGITLQMWHSYIYYETR